MPRDFLPVCRPGLPAAEDLLPYLRQIDAARHYTNRGPLARLLEQRLAQTLGLPAHGLRTASNGTSAIEIAIMAVAGPAKPDRPFALVPSYTFAATALAAERLGYIPIFADVRPDTWALDMDLAATHPRLHQIGLILPVAPYGRPPDLAGAEALAARTGIPVVLDAAACFEQLLGRPNLHGPNLHSPNLHGPNLHSPNLHSPNLHGPGLISPTVPMTISFHATKTFSTGEGGAVIWDNAAGQERVVRAANFGFNYSRRSESAGTNAKLSEFHAAVGLAMLDSFPQRRTDYARTVAAWRKASTTLPGRMHLPPDLASVYILWEAPDAASLITAQDALTDADIDTRRWYEAGLHVQPHFAAPRQTTLPVTEDLGARLLGLPMAHDMDQKDMARTVKTIQTALFAQASLQMQT